MNHWYELNEMNHDFIKFAVMITAYNNCWVIIKNKKRGGWEIPGGNREPGETVVFTASRELFEETGAIRFDLVPFGIYQWNGNYGMVFYADVQEFADLPDFEIEEIKFVDTLPAGMNFGDMFYKLVDKWNEYQGKDLKKFSMNMKDLKQLDLG